MDFSNNTVPDYINQVCNGIRNCFIQNGPSWYNEWFYTDRKEYYSLAESVVERSELKDIIETICSGCAGIKFFMIPTDTAKIEFFCIVSEESVVVKHELIYTLMLTQS